MHDETVEHYLLFCPAHGDAHQEMNRRGGQTTKEKAKLLSDPNLLRHLFRFIAKSERFLTIYGDYTNPIDLEP